MTEPTKQARTPKGVAPATPEQDAARAQELEAMKAAARIDFTKPCALVLDQTDSRNNLLTFQADTVAEVMQKANEAASEIAMKTGRPCGVFGPQAAVKLPPAKAVDMPLAFAVATREIAPETE